MKRHVTIEMVAKEAGVSRGTVDRVINQRPHVKEDQRARVIAAIEKLGYIPKNRQARALGIEVRPKEICRIGFVLPKRNEYFLKELWRGIHDGQIQLSDYSIEVLTEQCGASYPEETLDKIDLLVKQGVKGLVLSAVDSEIVADKINGLSDAGIPVVTIDTDVESKRLMFFGKNPIRSGRVAGALMAANVKPDDRIVIGIGSEEIEEHKLRMDSFIDAVRERQGGDESRFVRIETFGDYMMSYKKVKQALQDPRTRGVYMANHSLTGCMDAIAISGREEELCVISGDITDRTVHYLKVGELDFCVTPNVYMQGYQPLMFLKEYLRDGKVPASCALHAATEIICRENVPE